CCRGGGEPTRAAGASERKREWEGLRMLRHEVITPEKVPIRFRVAGMGSRLLAWLIDAGAVGLLLAVGAVLGAVLGIGCGGIGTALILLWIFAVRWGYFLVFEWLWQGQTPGKRVVGVRVIDWNGMAISFSQSAVRNLVRAVDALPMFYGLGF